MLENHYKTRVTKRLQKRAANSQKMIDDETLQLSFNDLIQREVEAGVRNFYGLSSIHQTLAIKKYFLELDDMDTCDLFYEKVGKNELALEIKKLFKQEISAHTFKKWLRKTVYERTLSSVDLAIREAACEWEDKLAGDQENRRIDDAIRVHKDSQHNTRGN